MNTAQHSTTTTGVSNLTDNENANVGAALRAMREGAGLTATEVGELSGLAPSRVGRLEHGAPSRQAEREAIACAIGAHLAGLRVTA